VNAPNDIQAQLRSLAIAKEQRPQRAETTRRGSAWKGFALLLLLIMAVLVGLRFVRPEWGQRIGAAVGTSAPAAPIRLAEVTSSAQQAEQPVLTATGKIVSDHRVAVSTKVSGQIVALHFEQGDRVERGQVLARVEDVLYRARRDEAAARLERSQANLAFQKVNFERVSKLAQSENAPDIEFADAKRALEEAAAQVEAEQATLDFTQKALNDCEVVAPIAGVVLTRNVEVGDFVAAEGGRGAMANAQFAIIADMSKLRVEVDISELDVVRIRKDMPCIIIPDAYKDRRYSGFVMWLDPGANYSKATVQAKVRVKDPDDHLRVEGSAQVAFFDHAPSDTPAESAGGVWIPASALRPGATASAGDVFVVLDGRLRQTAVTTGRRRGQQVEVLSGLTVGQNVVAERVETLVDGQAVR
jgi:RND family efflux transporter MFP subunit